MYQHLKNVVAKRIHNEYNDYTIGGGANMATKSILKEVRFKERSLCRGFASALENAQGKTGKRVVISRTCSQVKPEQIKSFFSTKQ